MRITMHAHAKINWALKILGCRADGYHELEMLMQSIELHDEITFEEARWLTLSVNGGPQEADERNLIVRAADALNRYSGQRRGARIDLRKHIPQRAGLGGGSADCAAALIALNRMWGLGLSMKTLMRIGLELGADVPFCLTGGLARVTGIGETVAPVEGAAAIPLAMVTPGNGLSTAAVFRAWDRGYAVSGCFDAGRLTEALRRRDLPAIQRLAVNDLTAPAMDMMPEIGDAMEAFRGLGADAVFMTGSGSTVVAAFRSEDAAQSAAAQTPGAVFTRTMTALPGMMVL